MLADEENLVKVFIDKKPEMIDVKNDKGKTPLNIAAGVKDAVNLVKYLVSKGADLNASDNMHETPLHVCSRSGKIHEFNTHIFIDRDLFSSNFENLGADDIAKVLIDNGANLNMRDNYDQLPILLAATSNTY